MFNFYPYTDFHEINLDWIIRKMKELGQTFNDFEAVNKITNAGAWDITKQYQAWTIVSDNNMGYISLKPVPAGVAITNIEYWGVIADYDIFITDLSNRISVLENQMAHVTRPRSYIIIGDSYAGTSQFIVETGRLLGFDVNNMTQVGSFAKRTPDKRFYTLDLGGMGFTDNGGAPGGGNGFLYLIQDLTAALTDDEKAVITDIAVVGGVNDAFFDITDPEWNLLEVNMVDFKNYIEANYSGLLNTWLGFIGRIRGTNPSNIIIDNVLRYVYQYTILAGKMGWRYITNIEYSLYQVDSLLGADNLHPGINGGSVIAAYLTEGLLNGSCDVKNIPNDTFTFTGTTGITQGLATTISRNVNNGITTLLFNTLDLTFSGITLPFGTDVFVGTQNGFFASKRITYSCAAVYLDTNHVWHSIILEYAFVGYNVYIRNMGHDQGITAITPVATNGPGAIRIDVPTMWL